jgi:hypothetical protein
MRPVKTQDTTDVVVAGVRVGTVVHVVDERSMTINNIALRGHLLYSGSVERSVIAGESTIYIRTTGEGVNRPIQGWLPNRVAWALNHLVAGPGWSSIDVGDIRPAVLSRTPDGQKVLRDSLSPKN